MEVYKIRTIDIDRVGTVEMVMVETVEVDVAGEMNKDG